ESTLDVVRPGATGGAIYQTLMDAYEKSDLPRVNLPHAGHSLGLEARELPAELAPAVAYSDPYLPPTSDFPLPESAVLNVEFNLGVEGFGGFQFEETVVLKNGGWESLTERNEALRITAV